ncbi:hypothetical protein VTJ49DRAFT_2464 [Mycothermus thermophilus]|uniref:Uncharacterized protein n=1 Tax=Humicola insolens TaxID=85995 RepID=A0ABR3VAA1_HUMIN
MAMLTFDIAPRAALAAPTEPEVIQTQSLVIVVASLLSILGAGWIIASFATFSSLRTFRHHLILGLAISDFIMALNFLSSSSMNVSGRWIGAPEQAGFCSFNGFMTQLFVIQTDYWVLIIALCTYFVLADHKRASSWAMDHLWLVWIVPWVLSVTWASIGMGVTGYGDIGAWCWFTSDEVRLFVNFVPRWAIISIMFAMYVRLAFILYGAHRRMTSLDESSGNPSGACSRQRDTHGHSSNQNNNTDTTPYRHTQKLKKLARLMLFYPLAYAAVWSLPTTIRIYQTIKGEPAPWQVQTLDKACIVIQGLVDAVIYGATEGSLSSWRNLLWPRKFPGIAASGSGSGADAGPGVRATVPAAADDDFQYFSGRGQVRTYYIHDDQPDLGCLTNDGRWTVDEYRCGVFFATRLTNGDISWNSSFLLEAQGSGPCGYDYYDRGTFNCGSGINATIFWRLIDAPPPPGAEPLEIHWYGASEKGKWAYLGWKTLE